MKKIALSFLILFTGEVFAVCATPISRTNASSNSVLTSTKYNADVNEAYNRVNNLPGDCIIDASITTAKLANGAVTTAKIADGAITSAKLASGAVPESGRLLRVSSFTSSGTWTKQSDVGAIMIQVVGGGAASFHGNAGSASSFGSHCTANGGSKPVASTGVGGAGGTASSGDINLTGGNGLGYSFSPSGHVNSSGGISFLGPYGAGGTGSSSFPSPGGGAGGYCAKLIDNSNLASTETVTVGAGGTNASSNTTPGAAGIVIVYEYSL